MLQREHEDNCIFVCEFRKLVVWRVSVREFVLVPEMVLNLMAFHLLTSDQKEHYEIAPQHLGALILISFEISSATFFSLVEMAINLLIN